MLINDKTSFRMRWRYQGPRIIMSEEVGVGTQNVITQLGLSVFIVDSNLLCHYSWTYVVGIFRGVRKPQYWKFLQRNMKTINFHVYF